MKIALFGGSFNPIHIGHMHIANELLKKKIVEQVWFIPCGKHAFGKELANNQDRLNMINLVLKNNPCLKVISVELNSEKNSYSAETIAWFKKEFQHEFYFVIGADNLESLDKWNNFDYLKKEVEFIIIKRPGFELNNKFGIKVKAVVDMKEDVSSSKIRENIKKGLPIGELVHAEVEKYISTGRLYK